MTLAGAHFLTATMEANIYYANSSQLKIKLGPDKPIRN